MNADEQNAHEAQLRTEQRTCAQCGYVIANPLTDRCPRCFSQVERAVKGCGQCTWQGNCDFAHSDNASKKEST